MAAAEEDRERTATGGYGVGTRVGVADQGPMEVEGAILVDRAAASRVESGGGERGCRTRVTVGMEEGEAEGPTKRKVLGQVPRAVKSVSLDQGFRRRFGTKKG